MNPNHIEIRSLIPHRPPAVCIDALIEVSEDYAVSHWQPVSNSLFVQGDVICEAGLLENAAQTAAAWQGYLKRAEQSAPQIGFVVAFKNVTIKRLPLVGETLKTKVLLNQSALNMVVYKFESWVLNELICQGIVQVVTQE